MKPWFQAPVYQKKKKKKHVVTFIITLLNLSLGFTLKDTSRYVEREFLLFEEIYSVLSSIKPSSLSPLKQY
jgi:hypothetical protein